ncbi:MAG: serine palmitoyltransferase, partial [Steroidobacteraceae bacterium]
MSLFSKFDEIRAGIEMLARNGRNPFDVRFDRVLSPTEAVLDGRPILLLGTNNYLGLTFDAACVEA